MRPARNQPSAARSNRGTAARKRQVRPAYKTSKGAGKQTAKAAHTKRTSATANRAIHPRTRRLSARAGTAHRQKPAGAPYAGRRSNPAKSSA